MFERIREWRRQSQVQEFAQDAIAHGRADVAQAVDNLRAAGVPWLQIFVALAPFIVAMLKGEPLDWDAVLKALQELFKK